MQGERLVEHLGLVHASRIPIEDEALRGVGLADALLDDRVGQVVRDEVTPVHVGVEAAPQRVVGVSSLPEHVASGDVRHPQVGGQPSRLGALPSAGWP